MPKVKTIYIKDQTSELSDCPNFSVTGSIKGMKKLYYGKNALLVKCGQYIYDVSNHPHLYESAH